MVRGVAVLAGLGISGLAQEAPRIVRSPPTASIGDDVLERWRSACAGATTLRRRYLTFAAVRAEFAAIQRAKSSSPPSVARFHVDAFHISNAFV